MQAAGSFWAGVSLMSISSMSQVHQNLQDEQGGQDQLAPLGQKGTMALLENPDQRETLDHLVRSWVWNAGVCRWCAAARTRSRRAQIPPQEEEKVILKVVRGYFRDGWSFWGRHSGVNIFRKRLPV